MNPMNIIENIDKCFPNIEEITVTPYNLIYAPSDNGSWKFMFKQNALSNIKKINLTLEWKEGVPFVQLLCQSGLLLQIQEINFQIKHYSKKRASVNDYLKLPKYIATMVRNGRELKKLEITMIGYEPAIDPVCCPNFLLTQSFIQELNDVVIPPNISNIKLDWGFATASALSEQMESEFINTIITSKEYVKISNKNQIKLRIHNLSLQMQKRILNTHIHYFICPMNPSCWLIYDNTSFYHRLYREYKSTRSIFF